MDRVSAFADYALALEKNDPLLALAVSFLDPSRRTRMLALLALNQQLRQIALTVAEPYVRASKLNWWHEELTRWQAQAPLHPITSVLTGVRLDREAINAWIAALHALSAESSVTDLETLTNALQPIARVERQLFGYAPNERFERALAVLNSLHDVRGALAAGRLLLPLDTLLKASLTRADLTDPLKIKRLEPQIAELARQLRVDLKCAPVDRLSALHLSFVRLRARQLARSPAAVFADGAPPLPLRSSFVCWRQALRWP